MREWRIILTLEDGQCFEGVGYSIKEDAENTIAEFRRKYPKFEDENKLKFSIERR